MLDITPATFTYMSEAVTAATVAAVHQYMNEATGDIGATPILAAYDGLTNAFNTVSNMVSLTTGQTLASASLTGAAAGVTVTATPEQAKLNHIANMLSACVNNAASTASPCVTLFANAVPPSDPTTTSRPTATYNAPTDVMQAAFYIFTNSTNSNITNRNNLYNLAGGVAAPYQPSLSVLPSDWSIGIQYAAAGTCGSAGNFINVAYDINVDETGDIWIANGQAGNGTLSELSPIGAPMACKSIPGGSRGGTIDINGRVWIGDSENNMIYRYDPLAATTLAFPTTTPPFALAADGLGNIYFSTVTFAFHLGHCRRRLCYLCGHANSDFNHGRYLAKPHPGRRKRSCVGLLPKQLHLPDQHRSVRLPELPQRLLNRPVLDTNAHLWNRRELRCRH